MTLGEWLARCEPPPPERLRTAIGLAVQDHLSAPLSRAPGVLLEVAESRLREMLASEQNDRRVAFELLTVDALITYAFQVAAENPELLPELANRAFRELSEITPS